jgi:hypothetical protein
LRTERRRCGVPTSHKNSASGNNPYHINVISAPVMLGSVAAMIMITYSQAIATTYTLCLAFYRIASKSCMLRSIWRTVSLKSEKPGAMLHYWRQTSSRENAAKKLICVDQNAVSNEHQRLIIFA